jgi:2'-5' RNA ligase
VTSLIAVDVALLLPVPVARQAVALSAALPRSESKGLRLNETHLPHVTLTQLFVDVQALSAVAGAIDLTLRDAAPLPLRIAGPGRGGSSIWMQIERTPALHQLHRWLMDALRAFEQPEGGPSAFAGIDARPEDLQWVARFRHESAYDRYTPHVTLGHATQPPHVEPLEFEATTVAMCQLGRFCTCRQVLQQWTLSGPASNPVPRPGTGPPLG